jgi:hypothetical protein
VRVRGVTGRPTESRARRARHAVTGQRREMTPDWVLWVGGLIGASVAITALAVTAFSCIA